MLRLNVAILACSLLTIGCVAPAGEVAPASALGDLASEALTLDGATRLADGALLWQGKELVGLPRTQLAGIRLDEAPLPTTDPGCSQTRCETIPFRLAAAGAFEVVVQAADSDQDYSFLATERSPLFPEYLTDTTFLFGIELLDADGDPVGDVWDSYHQASLAILENAPPGDYSVIVRADSGTSNYTAVLRMLSPAEPPVADPDGRILPDLRLEKPYNLRIDAPIGREIAVALGPTRGCGPDETTGAQATRCLRYATRIVNAGPGDFEERLRVADATASHALQEAHWMQRIDRADGTTEDVASGAAVYHPVHGHYHLNGLQRAYVHEFDIKTATRGAEVAQGQKTGLCMVDGGVADLTLPVAMPFGREAGCCYYAGFCEANRAMSDDFVQGISPGWFDTYPWWRADQYVDIAALPDGTYEFVSVVDPDGIVIEADETNNGASVIFRLTGDVVEVL